MGIKRIEKNKTEEIRERTDLSIISEISRIAALTVFGPHFVAPCCPLPVFILFYFFRITIII